VSKPRTKAGDCVSIGDGATATGALHAQESAVINGTVHGQVACRRLIVGKGGVAEGQIAVGDAEIDGKVGPHLVVKRLVAVGSYGRSEGEWTCGEFAVEKGGVLRGSAVFKDSASERKVV
jgi:cytoskeletal protein CcmA (bactofilin family)